MVRMPSIGTVALGGTVGATLRWAVLDVVGGATFPWPVLLVNLVGCTVLGLLIGLEAPRSTRLLLVEAAQMMRADDTTLAVAYVLCSMAGGLAAVVVGRAAGARIGNPRC